MWSRVPQIGKTSFLFRQLSYLYGIFLIAYYHWEKGEVMGWYEWGTIGVIMVVPIIFLAEFSSSKSLLRTHSKHVILDMFFVGWAIGTVNVTALPTFFSVLGAITNYIGVRGLKQVFWVLLIPMGTGLSLMASGFEIDFSYSNTLAAISMTYAFIHFIFLSFISYFYSSKFYRSNKILKKQKDEIDQQHEEILQQAEELKALNNSLSRLNNDLELAVQERTAELVNKNVRLAQHAYLNAHKLRAPLARILGLLQFFQYPDIVHNEQDVLKMLKESAQELDTIVSDINENLER